MRTYTVEVTWRVSEYAHLIVKAETMPEATRGAQVTPVRAERAR